MVGRRSFSILWIPGYSRRELLVLGSIYFLKPGCLGYIGDELLPSYMGDCSKPGKNDPHSPSRMTHGMPSVGVVRLEYFGEYTPFPAIVLYGCFLKWWYPQNTQNDHF